MKSPEETRGPEQWHCSGDVYATLLELSHTFVHSAAVTWLVAHALHTHDLDHSAVTSTAS